MSEWTLVPCLVTLRSEFNQVSPFRAKGADGAIGDSNHTSSSDHTPDEDSDILRDHDADDKNEVHALDTDSSGPWPGEGTQKERFHRKVMAVIEGEKAKWLDANDMCRLNYVIWDDQIYDKDNDFEPRAYLPGNSSRDRHTNHAHFSSRYETRAENDTRPFGVAGEIDDMAWTEKIKLSKDTAKELGPNYKEGQMVGADTLLQLDLIHSIRGEEKAQATVVGLAALVSRVDSIEKLLGTTPGATDDQVAAALKAALGTRAAAVAAKMTS